MPRKAESKRVKQGGKPKAAGKPKQTAKPQDGDTLVDLIEALNAPVAPQTAFNPPGRTFWSEPNGCVRGPEEDDAAFDRRVRANAESLKEMMLRNKHNATTVEARTDAELAIESMGTPGDFQRLEQEKRFEEDDRRRAEAEARALARPEGGKADVAGEEHPEPEKMCFRWRDLGKAGAAGGALFGLCEAIVYGIPWTWLRDHPATCGIQVAAGVFILVAALGWFVPPWCKFAWWSTLLIGLGLLILSRL